MTGAVLALPLAWSRRAIVALAVVALTAGVSAASLAGCSSAQSAHASRAATRSAAVASPATPPVLSVGAFSGIGGDLLLNSRTAALSGSHLDLQWQQFTDAPTLAAALTKHQVEAELVATSPAATAASASSSPAGSGSGGGLVQIGPIYRFADAFFAARPTTIAALPRGASIALPSSPAALQAALVLLAKSGLITLKAGSQDLSGVTANPRALRLDLVADSDLAAAVTSHALTYLPADSAIGAGLKADQAVLVGDAAAPVVLLSTPSGASSSAVKALYGLLTSPASRSYLSRTWGNLVQPVS
jgi:D-methionine transport system substrate-binding protein